MFKHQDFQMFRLKLDKCVMCNFHPLEVVDRASETQLQMGENLNDITLVSFSTRPHSTNEVSI